MPRQQVSLRFAYLRDLSLNVDFFFFLWVLRRLPVTEMIPVDKCLEKKTNNQTLNW